MSSKNQFTSKEYLAMRPEQQLFVREYLVDFDATAAYQRAGYTGKRPDVHGPRMTAGAAVAAAIAAEMQILFADLKITPGKILRDLEAARVAAMGAGKYSAAIMAIERMARYVNAFPAQYRSGNGDVEPAGFNEHNPDAPVPVEDVSRRILFLLTGALAKPAGEKPAAPSEPPVTIQ